ncbi:MAG: thioredoxin family protein [Schleiferiaceae bacterium]|nr:thioredoxin family protein [Schleiferiaceae bacterium]
MKNKWAAGMTYDAYQQLIASLLEKEQTTGPNQSPEMVAYTQLNQRRMKRLDKTHHVGEALCEVVSNLPKENWLVISEAWCGDAAQSLPILHKIAACNSAISFRIVLRDEHPELMEHYLTEGGKSIPILIRMNADFTAEIGIWGPRPKPAQEMLRAFKAQQEETYQEFAQRLHAWYAKDKGRLIESELLERIKKQHILKRSPLRTR